MYQPYICDRKNFFIESNIIIAIKVQNKIIGDRCPSGTSNSVTVPTTTTRHRNGEIITMDFLKDLSLDKVRNLAEDA
jgi:hypothetical protein